MGSIDIKFFDIEELGTWPIYSIEMEVHEGELQLTQHLKRERNPKIINLAKERFKQKNNGRVFCEVCGFDFFEMYGNIGDGFIEAHHKNPISKMKPEDITRVDDFVMVCSNCHSMLHKGTAWISHEELKSKLQKIE